MHSNRPRRTVLVTGGAGHLGRYVVRRFLAEGTSVHVPLFEGEDETALAQFLGDRLDAVRLHREVNLADPEGADRVVAALREDEGSGPDVLLNLAGGFASSPIEDTEPAGWQRMWEINASSAFLTSRAVFPGMKNAGWGRIVNVSAFPAIDRGKSGLSAYGAAKAAVLNLTQTLAREGLGHGITVNAVLPSIIDTPPNRSSMPDADRSTWLPPEEIASVLAFLASDEARIVNGAAITLTLG
ncbi:MAG: SDR family NAD(P)-dependent oxidoreductase [Gemmatimonadota bacterium]